MNMNTNGAQRVDLQKIFRSGVGGQPLQVVPAKPIRKIVQILLAKTTTQNQNQEQEQEQEQLSKKSTSLTSSLCTCTDNSTQSKLCLPSSPHTAPFRN